MEIFVDGRQMRSKKPDSIESPAEVESFCRRVIKYNGRTQCPAVCTMNFLSVNRLRSETAPSIPEYFFSL
jgi:hypothetical protein